MSKSLGNVIDPVSYIKNYGSDALRYYLMKEIPIDNDGIFSHDLFINLYNNDLANNYGNLISRFLGMMQKYTNNMVSNPNKFTLVNADLINKQIDNLEQEIIKNIKSIKIGQVLKLVMSIGDVINKYIQDVKP